jgi:hypothetical protein
MSIVNGLDILDESNTRMAIAKEEQSAGDFDAAVFSTAIGSLSQHVEDGGVHFCGDLNAHKLLALSSLFHLAYPDLYDCGQFCRENSTTKWLRSEHGISTAQQRKDAMRVMAQDDRLQSFGVTNGRQRENATCDTGKDHRRKVSAMSSTRSQPTGERYVDTFVKGAPHFFVKDGKTYMHFRDGSVHELEIICCDDPNNSGEHPIVAHNVVRCYMCILTVSLC